MGGGGGGGGGGAGAPGGVWLGRGVVTGVSDVVTGGGAEYAPVAETASVAGAGAGATGPSSSARR